MSEVVPEDEDRGGDGAIGGALQDGHGDGGSGDASGPADEEEGGTGADDGGPGSQNM
jgi:hypothetical protein